MEVSSRYLSVLVILYGISWSISDSFVLITYSVLLMFAVARILSGERFSVSWKDPTLGLPASLTLWRWFTSLLSGNLSLKVLWKGAKFLFDISPVLVFRQSPFKNTFNLIVASFLVSLTLMTLLVLAVKFLKLPFDVFSGSHMKGFFVNHLKSGFVWSLGGLICAVVGIKYTRKAFLLLPLILYGLMITHARSYYLGFIGALLFVSFLLAVKYSVRYTFYGLATLCGFAGFIYLIEPVRQRFLSIFTGLETDGSIKCRLYMWKEATMAFKDSPLTGIGFQNWSDFFAQKGYPCPNYHAHNIYIHELVETGVVGFLLVSAFLLFIMYRLIKSYMTVRGEPFAEAVFLTGIAATLNFMIGGLFEPSLVKTVVLIPTFTLVGIALGMAEERAGGVRSN